MTKPLNQLHAGDTGYIVKVNSEKYIKRRLMDMGLTLGSNIECISTAPFGDPTAFLIKGTVIAIRNCDSKYIFVEQEETV